VQKLFAQSWPQSQGSSNCKHDALFQNLSDDKKTQLSEKIATEKDFFEKKSSGVATDSLILADSLKYLRYAIDLQV
jgi:hypothetical protein